MSFQRPDKSGESIGGKRGDLDSGFRQNDNGKMVFSYFVVPAASGHGGLLRCARNDILMFS